MTQEILNFISSGISILLVGESNSGKTFFVKNKLIPFLEERNKKIIYFKNMDELTKAPKDAIMILDEFEILEDKAFLEKSHPEEKPYYTEEYLKCVHRWIKKAKSIKNPCIYILTRNEKREIENVKKIKNFSFKKEMEMIEFKKS